MAQSLNFDETFDKISYTNLQGKRKVVFNTYEYISFRDKLYCYYSEHM